LDKFRMAFRVLLSALNLDKFRMAFRFRKSPSVQRKQAMQTLDGFTAEALFVQCNKSYIRLRHQVALECVFKLAPNAQQSKKSSK